MKPKFIWVAALLLVLPATLATAAIQPPERPAAPAPAATEAFQRTSLYIPSQDGTRIAIDVYRPMRNGALVEGKLPAIFTQDRSGPRGGRGGAVDLIRAYTSRGYVWVAQDRRGTGGSFGVQKGFVNMDDAQDAKAVVEWTARQPWSNGRVGGYGCSNQGAHQYMVATLAPKGLASIAPECSSPAFFEAMMSINGVSTFAGGDQPTYKGECNAAATPGAPVDEDIGPEFPLAKAAAQLRRCNAAFLGQYMANMHRDTLHPFLDYRPGLTDSAIERAAQVKASGVKVLSVIGWFDAAPVGVPQSWRMWGGHVVLGPWGHGQTRPPSAKLTNGEFDRNTLYGRWYDATLKGIDNGFLNEAPIRYYTMGAAPGTEWRYAAAWPLPNTTHATFYLGDGKSGTVNSLNDGVLAKAKPAAGADTYKPDYSADLFEGRFQALQRFWEGDMRKSMDEKGLTYTTAPLDDALQITGHPVARLWVTSTAADEDFFAFLEDVAPDGRSTYVTDGKIRASRRKVSPAPWGDPNFPYHRQLKADDRPLSATAPAELAFDLIATSHVFPKGHRVRITVVNAAGKAFQPYPGQDRKNPPTIRLLRDAAHPSSITLPVIPAGSSVFSGQATINAAGVRYQGPADLYVSDRGTYLRYGERWAAFAPAGKSGASSYPVRGPLGVATARVNKPAAGPWSATLTGAGLTFSGQGRDSSNGAGGGLGKA